MLDHSNLEQLRRLVKSFLNTGTITKKAALWLMEVIDHYEQTIQDRGIREPEASDKRPRTEVDRGSQGRSRRASNKRRSSVRSGSA